MLLVCRKIERSCWIKVIAIMGMLVWAVYSVVSLRSADEVAAFPRDVVVVMDKAAPLQLTQQVAEQISANAWFERVAIKESQDHQDALKHWLDDQSDSIDIDLPPIVTLTISMTTPLSQLDKAVKWLQQRSGVQDVLWDREYIYSGLQLSQLSQSRFWHAWGWLFFSAIVLICMLWVVVVNSVSNQYRFWQAWGCPEKAIKQRVLLYSLVLFSICLGIPCAVWLIV